jgi:CheY-like chemotaxis protein
MENMISSSSSRAVAAVVRDNTSKMIAEANRELRQLFRSSRQIKLSDRSGYILLVDDVPQQKTVLEKMAELHSSSSLSVACVQTAKDARDFVDTQSKEVRLVVVDIMLIGSAALPDGTYAEDGISFVEWIQKNYPDIPFVITTGHAERADEAIARFPGVDVLLKGQTGIEEYAEAIGLVESNSIFSGVLPSDE